jgi:chemotaxis signal transduction protein
MNNKYLIFECGSTFGIDLGNIGEVIELSTIEKLANSTPFLLGLYNISSQLFPVISLNIINDREENIKPYHQLALVVHTNNYNFILPIDNCIDIITIDNMSCSLNNNKKFFIQNTYIYEEKTVYILDVYKLINFDEIEKEVGKYYEKES